MRLWTVWNRRNVDTGLYLIWTCIFWLSLSRNLKGSLGLWPRQDLILDHSGRTQGLGACMFPWQTANITQSASLEGILQLLSGGKVKTERRGWKKEKRRQVGRVSGEEKQEEGTRPEREARSHEIWNQHTKQPSLTIRETLGNLPVIIIFFLSLSFTLPSTLPLLNKFYLQESSWNFNQPALSSFFPLLFNI